MSSDWCLRAETIIMFLFSEKTANANDVGCVLCEFVMNELDKILQKNATEVSLRFR